MSIDEYLSEVEVYVDKKFGNIQIISEAKIPFDKYLKISSNIKRTFENNKRNEDRVIQRLWLSAPKTCLMVTVNYAIYNYSGSFWSPFKKALSFENDTLWKNYFFNTILQQGLVVFHPKSSQKFISNILGHAGIPKENVNDFLRNVIIPAVNFNLDVEEIIAAIKSEKNSGSVIKSYGLYKGVKDFIKLDTPVSRDFLERCMEIWREQERPFTENHSGYLPDHILFQFDEFSNDAKSISAEKLITTVRPILGYSTIYQNIFIKFPVQRFYLNEYEKVEWKINSRGREDRISTYKANSSENKESEFYVGKNNGEYPILPGADYEVFLYVDSELVGEWTFYNSDLFIFNSGNFELERKNVIAADRAVFVIKEEQLPSIKNIQAHCVTYPLIGPWEGYYEVEVTITGFSQLRVGERELILNNSSKWFELQGSNWENIKSDAQTFNKAPTLKVSNELIGLSKDVNNWKIRLLHKWSNKSVRENINNLPVITGDEFSIISLESLMKKENFSFGKYTLSLTGVLGQDKRFDFNYIPESSLQININENEKTVIHDSNLDVTFNTTLDVVRKSNTSILITDLENRKKAEGLLINTTSKESLPIVLYNSLYNLEIKIANEFFNAGEKFDSSSFTFSNSSILVDFENPTLQNKTNSLTITLMERLATNEIAKKSYTLRTGRKHLIDLTFFSSLNNTKPIRKFAIKIDELQAEQHLFSIETQWEITELKIKDEDFYHLSWGNSFNAPNREARIWSFEQSTPIATLDLKEGINDWRLESDSLQAGYYLFEIADVENDDFLALFEEVSYPKMMNTKTALISKGIDIKKYTFTRWLLLDDLQDDEIEWTTSNLKQLLDLIYQHEELYMPLLWDSYSEVCDFGLRNIDELLELFTKIEDKKYVTFLHRISGFQEWDINSFSKVIENNLVSSTMINQEYIPVDLVTIDKMTYYELGLSYQRSQRKENLIRDFSLRHEYLKHYSKLETEKEYLEEVSIYLNMNKARLEDLLHQLVEKDLIPSHLYAKLMSRQLTPEALSFPFVIGLVAFGTATILFAESQFSYNFIVDLRQLVPILFELNEDWFLHDLVYWKNELQKEEESKKDLEERKRQYEHTSFTWKK